MTIRTSLIALAALALAAPAGAQATATRSVSVRYADLDLSQPNGRAMLDRRIASAINQVCFNIDGGRNLQVAVQERRCRRAARASAQQQVAAIADRSQQLASLAAITIAGR